MPQIIAWKCSVTNQIFQSKQEYKIHLKLMARERLRTRRREAAKARIKQDMAVKLNKISTTEELCRFICDNVADLSAYEVLRPGPPMTIDMHVSCTDWTGDEWIIYIKVTHFSHSDDNLVALVRGLRAVGIYFGLVSYQDGWQMRLPYAADAIKYGHPDGHAHWGALYVADKLRGVIQD